MEFLRQYSNVFSWNEFDLGRTSLIVHRIDMDDAKPFCQGLRRHPQAYLDVIDTEIAKMEAAGVIEDALSPWASNIVVVAKYDNTPRITLDYRQLNNLTYKDSYPLPNIANCLDAFKGASCFAVLDFHSSFYQVNHTDAEYSMLAEHGFNAVQGNFTTDVARFIETLDLAQRHNLSVLP